MSSAALARMFRTCLVKLPGNLSGILISDSSAHSPAFSYLGLSATQVLVK